VQVSLLFERLRHRKQGQRKCVTLLLFRDLFSAGCWYLFFLSPTAIMPTPAPATAQEVYVTLTHLSFYFSPLRTKSVHEVIDRGEKQKTWDKRTASDGDSERETASRHFSQSHSTKMTVLKCYRDGSIAIESNNINTGAQSFIQGSCLCLLFVRRSRSCEWLSSCLLHPRKKIEISFT